MCSLNSASAGSDGESVEVIESESTGTDKLPGALDVVTTLYSQVRDYSMCNALYCPVLRCSTALIALH